MIKFLKVKIVLSFLFLALPLGGIFAAQDDGVFSYAFHLYFDNGVLVKDRDFEFSFDLIAQEFEVVAVPEGSYKGEILSVSNKKLAEFLVSVPATRQGKISSLAPYFDNAKTVNFYNPQGQKLLSIDLAPSGPVCNEDKLCNADTGETYLNCPSDCQAPATPMPSPQLEPSFLDNMPILTLIIILILVIIAVVVWFFLKRKKGSFPEVPLPPVPPTDVISPTQ